jgi:hypothetical protein
MGDEALTNAAHGALAPVDHEQLRQYVGTYCVDAEISIYANRRVDQEGVPQEEVPEIKNSLTRAEDQQCRAQAEAAHLLAGRCLFLFIAVSLQTTPP